ncbi:hypothetical protein [Mycobacterium intracellulare]
MTTNELAPVIRRAAKSVAFQWPGVVEADDVEQSIHLRLLESGGSVSRILEMDERARYRAIVGIGHQIASQERTDYDHFKGSYTYSVAEIKGLLKMGILTETPPPHFKAELIDMEMALASMVEKRGQYVDAIHVRYVDEITPKTKSEEDALRRGLTALADAMNKVARNRHEKRDDGPGTRQVLTRAQALDLSASEWDGEEDE